MDKAFDVYEEIGRRYREERGREFTAGQVAKMAGVCRNTARKYLITVLYQDDSLLRVRHRKLGNGLIADIWYFSESEF